jgi:hypothetical protein
MYPGTIIRGWFVGKNKAVGERPAGRQFGLSGPGSLTGTDLGDGAAALRRALASLREDTGAAGVAMIVAAGSTPPWAVYDGRGGRRAERWLRDATAELEATGGAPSLPGATDLCATPGATGVPPLVLPLGGDGGKGLLVLWSREPAPAAGGIRARAEVLARSLGLLLEVEERRRLHLGDGSHEEELATALRGGDEGAVSSLLALARTAAGADLAYWGTVHDDVVDVSWHLGARDGGFGFELPLGQGVGGRAFAGERTLEVPDYLNCQYRYPGVSDVTDSEEVRTTLAVPVRGADAQTGAVLYAVRCEISPFSPTERLLLSRLAQGIGPLPGARVKGQYSFPVSGHPAGSAKSELRRMVLEQPEVRELEAWIEHLVKGTTVLVDRALRPYVPAKADRFEELLASDREPVVVPLEHPRIPAGRGSLYLWPSVDLPPDGWPDLLDDVATACVLVLDRAEQAYEGLNHARSRWLRDVSEGRVGPAARREGNRLGLPVDRGVVWAVAWRPEGNDAAGQIRRMMLAEDATLDRLGSPLISGEAGVGVLLLKEEAHERPAAVRDELLRFFGPAPLWLVYGVAYDSLEALRDAHARVVTAVKRARDEGSSRPVQEIGGQGLDGLLENPKLSGELEGFARGALGPLLLHDAENGSQLTQTLCLTLAEGQEAAAKQLFVHANTVRYRVKRAAQILGADLDSPKERTALSLAALIQLRQHDELP